MPTLHGLASATLAGLTALTLAGCGQRTDNPPKPATEAPTAASASSSVASPPSAMPPSDAAMAPAQAGQPKKTTDADGPTQATPKDLSKGQETSTMPLAGQVNNHSTPATTNEEKK